MTKRIELPQVQRLIDQHAQLVEVLPPAEYAEVHLPGAINIPSSSSTRTPPRRLTASRRSLSTATTTSET